MQGNAVGGPFLFLLKLSKRDDAGKAKQLLLAAIVHSRLLGADSGSLPASYGWVAAGAIAEVGSRWGEIRVAKRMLVCANN